MSIKKRIRTIFAVVLLALAATGVAQAAGLSQREASVLSVVNEVRAGHGLRQLAVDTRLVRVARGHTATVLRTDVLTHGAMADRLRRSGARGPRFGENLAWGVGRRATAAAVVRSWLASPGHRANLLRPGYRRIGIGALTGRFAGHRGATVVTVDFAGR
jgi:uncharacterized protein YkwD